MRGPGAQRGRRVVGGWLALLLPLVALGSGAHARAGSTAPRQDGRHKLSRITIQAAKERQALRLKVDHFVTSVIVQPQHESLERWNAPVCPLVAGLPRNLGEFVLARISRAARAAHAPLAGRHCQANLFVIATAQPALVLRKWVARDPQIYLRHGMGPLERFLKSRQPVRVWYNTVAGCGGSSPYFGAKAAAELNSVIIGDATGATSPEYNLGPSHCQDTIDTHLSYGDVRSIYSAIVVVDTNRLTHVMIGQLADYVSLVSLADVRSGTDGGGAPTILRLFRDPDAPEGLTPWDQALLYSLYNTSQTGKLQLTDMELSMVGRMAP